MDTAMKYAHDSEEIRRLNNDTLTRKKRPADKT